jgi:hypothetical protein
MKIVEPLAPRKGTVVPIAIPNDGKCLAIDPGNHTGWALFLHGGLIACGTGTPPSQGVAHAVIEYPQVYPRSPVPPNSIVKLAFTAGRLVGELRLVADIKMVLPHDWKGDLPKDVCAARAMKKLNAGELRVVAEAREIIKGKFDDVMDAVALGLYAFGGRR